MTIDQYTGSANPSAPQTLNRYSYVGSDPVNYYDPSGLDSILAGACTVGAGEHTQLVPCELYSFRLPGMHTVAEWDELHGRKPKCPPVPTHPGVPDDQIQKMIKQTENVFSRAIIANAATGFGDPLSVLLGFLAGQFSDHGPWDFKDALNVKKNSPEQLQLRDFGNFAFGAVLNSQGFSYYQTQNAADIAQIKICWGGGACGTGTPGRQCPFGDQVSDARAIKRGFDYEATVRSGDCEPRTSSEP